MRPRSVRALVCAALCLGSAQWGWALSEGAPAPDFALPDLSGRTVSLADASRGKAVVVLVFWASWDTYLREEMRIWDGLARRYGPRGLAVVAINKGEGEQVTRGAVGSPAPAFLVLAADQEVVRRYNVKGVPDAFVLDGKGIVRRRVAGYGPRMEPKLRQSVEELLPAPPARIQPTPPPQAPKAPPVSPKLARMRAYCHLRLGITHVELGDLIARSDLGDDGHFVEAIAEFRTSIGLDPTNVDAHIWLGAACERAGRLEEAARGYQGALKVDPHNAYAREGLRRVSPPKP